MKLADLIYIVIVKPGGRQLKTGTHLVYVCVCVFVCVYVRPIVVAWYGLYDWLNKFYSFYVAAVVSIVSMVGLSIDVHHENLPNKHKLALFKPSINFNSSL